MWRVCRLAKISKGPSFHVRWNILTGKYAWFYHFYILCKSRDDLDDLPSISCININSKKYRVYSVTGEKPHTLTTLIHDIYSIMWDQRIRVNWKRNTQLQRIMHYFIVSRIISAAMLCTVRTLLLWDLLTRMIIELNSHVAIYCSIIYIVSTRNTRDVIKIK